MTKDEIIALAEKHCYCSSSDHKEFLHEGLVAFAEQLLASERARCLKIAEHIGKKIGSDPPQAAQPVL